LHHTWVPEDVRTISDLATSSHCFHCLQSFESVKRAQPPFTGKFGRSFTMRVWINKPFGTMIRIEDDLRVAISPIHASSSCAD
jgi:hypothetical protein